MHPHIAYRSRPSVLALIALLLLAFAGAAAAQTVTRVADLFTGAGNDPDGLGVEGARNGSLGGLTYFAGTDQDGGAELWVTGGTAASTRRFADICPGRCSSNPKNFHVEGNRVYFSADDGRRGIELWSVLNGSAAPAIVADIHPGAGSSEPADFIRVVLIIQTIPVQRTYFTATDPLRGRELWRLTNGFAALEFDIEPGPASSNPRAIGSLGIQRLLVLATTAGLGREPHVAVYLSTTQPPAAVPLIEDLVENGEVRDAVSLNNVGLIAVQLSEGPFSERSQLWRTLGSASNTERLLPGVGLSELRDLTVHEGLSKVFFVADTGDGQELFASDGTEAGTGPVMDDSSIVAAPRALLALGGGLLFLAGSDNQTVELWGSDGSSANTDPIEELPGQGSVLDAGIVRASDGSRAYIHHADQLLRINSAGTQVDLVRALGGPGAIADIRATSGLGVLISHDVGSGEEPFHSNGTFAGTIPLGNLNTDVGSADPTSLVAVGERMTFNPRADGEPPIAFSTLGSAATTSAYFPASLSPLGFLGAQLVGVAPFQIYTIGDGSTGGTVDFDGPVSRSADRGPPFQCSAELNGLLYFIGSADGGSELFRSDGSTPGTVPVTDITTDSGSGRVSSCVTRSIGGVRALGNRVLFVGDLDGSTGMELLSSNGIDAPVLVADINPGSSGSFPRHLTRFGNRVVFSATTALHGTELWITDGTAQGTTLLADIEPGPTGSNPHSLAVLDFGTNHSVVAFLATTFAAGTELWATQSIGASQQTFLVADLFPGQGSAFRPDNTREQSLFWQGRRLFFAATLPGTQRCPLYVVDGADIGCAFTVNQFAAFEPARTIVPLANGAIAFAAWEASDGEEIRVWRDGRLLPLAGADIRPGPAGGAPANLAATVRGQVYFSANDGSSGRELWRLDLTDFLFADGFD